MRKWIAACVLSVLFSGCDSGPNFRSEEFSQYYRKPSKKKGYQNLDRKKIVYQVLDSRGRKVGKPKLIGILEKNDIICNFNLLPHDDPKKVMKPSGLRLGVQEMTHFGMKEPEMEEIARLFKECLIGGKDVKSEVNRLRSRFLGVQYGFDQPVSSEDAPTRKVTRGRPGPVDVDLAGY